MRWSPCKNCPIVEDISQDDEYLKEIQRKELDLKQKEKELLKKDKVLQRKIKKFKNRKRNKAKKDLKAAAKLRDARRQLLLTLDTKEKAKKYDMHIYKKWNITHVRDANTKQKKKKTEKVKRDPCSPVQYFNDLLNRPCDCSAQGKNRRPLQEPDSLLKKLFGRPCSCKYLNKNDGRSYSPCKCRERQESSARESYWERAAGDCYLMSLRRPPQLWLYHRWPQFYPRYLDVRHQCKNCGHIFLFLAGILFWTPCLLCLELCKCCFCACCAE